MGRCSTNSTPIRRDEPEDVVVGHLRWRGAKVAEALCKSDSLAAVGQHAVLEGDVGDQTGLIRTVQERADSCERVLRSWKGGVVAELGGVVAGEASAEIGRVTDQLQAAVRYIFVGWLATPEVAALRQQDVLSAHWKRLSAAYLTSRHGWG